MIPDEELDSVDFMRMLGRLRGELFGVKADPVRVGRYALRRVVGSGGAGRVFEAYDPRLERRVAVKLLWPGPDGAREARRQAAIVGEARALAKLTHPNIVEIYDAGTHDGEVFIAMEFVDGLALGEHVAQTQPSPADVVGLYIQAARGLAAAHRAGLVHRDFKPANCLVGTDGRVRVVDLGLARRPEERASSSPSSGPPALPETTRLELGTPAYMAPEQAAGRRADERSDQYSFCVSLVESLTGTRPVLGPDDSVATIEVPASVDRVTLRTLAVARRGLVRDATKRWPSMQEVAAALQASTRGNRWPLAVAALVLSGAGAAWIATRAPTSATPAGCDAPAAALKDAWNDDARARIRTAFMATKLAYAPDAFALVAAKLDAGAEAWTAAYAAACTDRDADATTFDRRMLCLAGQRRTMQALVDALGQARPKTVAAAAGAVGAWADRNDCLRDPQTAIDDGPYAASLEQAQVGISLGDYDRVATLVDELQLPTDATAARIRAMYLRSLADLGRGKYPEAAGGFEATYEAAVAHGVDEYAVRAALKAVSTLGQGLADQPAAARWLRHAEAALERLGEHPELAADLEDGRGIVAGGSGDMAASLRHHLEALRQRRTFLPEDHRRVVTSMGIVAVAQLQAGDAEAGAKTAARAVAATRSALGDRHPAVGDALNRLGVARRRLHDHEGARQAHQRALALRIELFGEPSAPVAQSLTNLGAMYIQARDWQTALPIVVRAEQAQRETRGDDSPKVVSAANNHCVVLGHLGRHEQALRVCHDALETVVRLRGDEHPRVAMVRNSLGGVLLAMGRHREAIEQLERAVEIWTAARGEEDDEVASAMLELGRAHQALGELDAAADAYARSHTIWTKSRGPDDTMTAKARLGWATSRPDDPRSRAWADQAAAVLLAPDAHPQDRQQARAQLELLESGMGQRGREPIGHPRQTPPW